MSVGARFDVFWQEFCADFTKAFVTGGRWKLYLSGIGTTLEVTILALLMGIALGVIVAVIRTAHDQQRPGHRNFVLGILDAVCKIYTTVIRGTPMIVQMLIMGSVIFANSRNFTIIGTIALGINSGAYVAEIVRGGLMSVDIGCNMTTIGGKELLYAAKAVGAKTYSVMFPLLGVALIYLVLVMIMTWLQGKLERRLRASDRR